ncbi:MAG TPA: hypothetical protein VGN40_21585 [Lelliottia sp.]|jgi:hypothetical protein
MKQQALDNPAPYFKFDYKIPSDFKPIASLYVLMRFNNYLGDGSVNAWVQPIPGSEITVIADGQPIQIDYFNGYTGPRSAFNNFDQFCQYFQALVTTRGVDVQPNSVISIYGQFKPVSYFTTTIYIAFVDGTTTQIDIRAKDMPVEPPGLNPYVEGNPSIFSYDTPIYLPLDPIINSSSIEKEKSIEINSSKIGADGRVDIYRIDAQSATTGSPDGMEPDGCPDYYMTNPGETTSSAQILRIKIPNTVIQDSTPDMTFGSYQCSEYTICAYKMGGEDPILDYWATCSRQMHENMDENGYAYVFFLSDDYVNTLITEQNTPDLTPPIVTWGIYKGVALGIPNDHIVIRLRGPSENWAGAPINTVCYLTPADNQPLNKEELGEWLPELYADTFENFSKGNIGAVFNNQPWPDSN